MHFYGMSVSRKVAIVAGLAAVAGAAWVTLAPAASAGSPRVASPYGSLDVSRTDDTLTMTGDETGLGDHAQVQMEATATASCVNGGDAQVKTPKKESVSTKGDFPVKGGKVDFSLTLKASFGAECTAPKTIEFTDIQVCDLTSKVCCGLTGTSDTHPHCARSPKE